MRQLGYLFHVVSRWPRVSSALGLFIITAVLGSPSIVRAERFPPGPVEDLRQALRQDKSGIRTDPVKEFRRTLLEKRVAAVQSLGDLSQALLLPEWQTLASSGLDVEAIEEAARRQLADRFVSEVRRVLEKGDAVDRAAAAGLVGDTATLARERDTQSEAVQTAMAALAKDLVKATTDADPRVRLQAIRSLGRIQVEPATTTVAPLGRLLAGESLIERRAAAEALNNLVRILPQVRRVRKPTGDETGGGIGLPRRVRLEIYESIGPAAGKGLADQDAQVRRLCTDTLLQTALSLSTPESELIGIVPRERDLPASAGRPLTEPEKKELEFERAAVERERKELTPLLNAFRDLVPALATAASDPEPAVRVLALRTLEELGHARTRLLAREANVPEFKPAPDGNKNGGDRKKEESKKVGGEEARSDTEDGVRYAAAQARTPSPSAPAVREGQDPLLDGLRKSLRALAKALGDPKPQVRLAAVDALETLGDAAAPAAPHLTWALTDPDRFVRWAAARTLGRMSPEKVPTPEVVRYLARMLNDPDLDLRLIAAQSLERYGPAAKAAVPGLTQALGRGDAEIRRAAILALVGIGTDAAPAVPSIAAALGHPDVRVRRAAAEALSFFGELAKPAEPALRQALNDGDAEVRRHAEDALLRIK